MKSATCHISEKVRSVPSARVKGVLDVQRRERFDEDDLGWA
ncbi:MAG: hypothetical protein U5R14_10640 [Gemmatimonadota bacterium]|nr:hypothetical protein [Gemmatimonadota bacterium]